MTLRHLQRIESDEDYYINNNYNPKSIMDLLNDINKAKTVLAEYEARLFLKYNEAVMATDYYRVKALRYKNDYGDKKVSIRIRVEKFKMLDGLEVREDSVYSDCKEFTYQDMTEALLHVYAMLNKYPGSIYHNETPYKRMEI